MRPEIPPHLCYKLLRATNVGTGNITQVLWKRCTHSPLDSFSRLIWYIPTRFWQRILIIWSLTYLMQPPVSLQTKGAPSHRFVSCQAVFRAGLPTSGWGRVNLKQQLHFLLSEWQCDLSLLIQFSGFSTAFPCFRVLNLCPIRPTSGHCHFYCSLFYPSQKKTAATRRKTSETKLKEASAVTHPEFSFSSS